MEKSQNAALHDFNAARRAALKSSPQIWFPWRRSCPIKTLLVTDGALDFSERDFGLSAFILALQEDAPAGARFDITVAHLRTSPDNAAMGASLPNIARRITDFRFDSPSHFDPDAFDAIFLFGFETNFYATGFSNPYETRNANRQTYPQDRLGDAELARIAQHMNRGGGMFATGDHGALGRNLCSGVIRVRGMRHWADFTTSPPNESQVSMLGGWRNDTNRRGRNPTSEFDDQSDDIPQTIQPKFYARRSGFQKARWPHPLLCGRNGVIDVMPDHPHEGECRIPADLTSGTAPDGSPEWPNGPDGAPVSPEVIATNTVNAGNVYAGKDPSVAHSFGSISAYDGHAAGVGRVVCDSTWHHFVNINLIGVFNDAGASPEKRDGFLSSPEGQAALERITNYFVNIGVWIAPADRQRCIRSTRFWDIVFTDRIVEAALVDPSERLEAIPSRVAWSIGVHARDVLDRAYGPCQSLQFVVDFIETVWPEIVFDINPWIAGRDRKEAAAGLPLVDPMPLVEAALGGAILALRAALPYPERIERMDEKATAEIMAAGARRMLAAAVKESSAALVEADRMLSRLRL